MKAEPRTGFNFDLGSTVPRLSIGAALTLTWRTTKEHQKNGQLRKQLVTILESEKTLGKRLAAQVTTQTDRVAIGKALARRSSAMRTQCERYANAGTRGVSLGGATLGPVPSLPPLNRSFSVACRLSDVWVEKLNIFVMEVCW